jgi:hypothetical protein
MTVPIGFCGKDVTIELGGSSKQWHMAKTEDQIGGGIEGLAVPVDFRQKC